MTAITDICVKSPFPFGTSLSLNDDEHGCVIYNKVVKLVEQAAPKLIGLYQANLPKSTSDLKAKVAYFNEVVKIMKNQIETDEWRAKRCSITVTNEIIQLTTVATCPNYQRLKQTKRSNDRGDNYGEINAAQMESLVKELQPGRHDVFGDLGSGIGQFVCYVAAATPVAKCFGIELDAERAATGAKFVNHFERFMKFFSKSHGRVALVQGDILDEKYRPLICKKATVLFANNYTFPSFVNYKLEEEVLKNCKDGLRMVSTLELALGSRHRLHGLHRHSLCAMVDRSQAKSVENGFSWGPKPVTLHVLTIKRENLRQLIEEIEMKQSLGRKRKRSNDNDDSENAAKKTAK